MDKEQTNGKYYLPVEFKSHMDKGIHATYVFSIIFLLFLSYYFAFVYNDSYIFIMLAICFAILSVMVLIRWMFYGILKLGKIEIDNHELYFRTITQSKRVRWEKVLGIGSQVTNNQHGPISRNFYITIEESVKEQTVVRKLLSRIIGKANTYYIPLSCFSDLRIDSLIRTVNGIIEYMHPVIEEPDEDVYPEDEI